MPEKVRPINLITNPAVSSVLCFIHLYVSIRSSTFGIAISPYRHIAECVYYMYSCDNSVFRDHLAECCVLYTRQTYRPYLQESARWITASNKGNPIFRRMIRIPWFWMESKDSKTLSLWLTKWKKNWGILEVIRYNDN